MFLHDFMTVNDVKEKNQCYAQNIYVCVNFISTELAVNMCVHMLLGTKKVYTNFFLKILQKYRKSRITKMFFV